MFDRYCCCCCMCQSCVCHQCRIKLCVVSCNQGSCIHIRESMDTGKLSISYQHSLKKAWHVSGTSAAILYTHSEEDFNSMFLIEEWSFESWSFFSFFAFFLSHFSLTKLFDVSVTVFWQEILTASCTKKSSVSLDDGGAPSPNEWILGATCLCSITLLPCLFLNEMLWFQLQPVTLLTVGIRGGVCRGGGCYTIFFCVCLVGPHFFLFLCPRDCLLIQRGEGIAQDENQHGTRIPNYDFLWELLSWCFNFQK